MHILKCIEGICALYAISHEEVARRIGTAPANVSRYFSLSVKKPDPELVAKMLQMFTPEQERMFFQLLRDQPITLPPRDVELLAASQPRRKRSLKVADQSASYQVASPSANGDN